MSEEGSFIWKLARAWDVQYTPIGGGNLWTVLSPNSEANGWTTIHDLALIYLHLAHQTDGELSDAEVHAIARKLSEWIPDADEARVLGVVQESVQAYIQGSEKRLFEDSVKALERCMPSHQRSAMFEDLHFVANADGGMSQHERDTIERLARLWRVKLNEQES
jgi:uncharacterized tellurite resistance protein B-like protein